MSEQLRVLAVGAALAGWLLSDAANAAANEDGAESEEELSVEEILTREPDADDYQLEDRCVQTTRIRRTEVLDDKHIALNMGRDEYYIIQFDRRCIGLRRNSPVIFEPTVSTRLCVHDNIRPSYDGFGGGGWRPGSPCRVPGFEKVTKEQVVMLKEELKVRARIEREERKAARKAAKEAKQQADEGAQEGQEEREEQAERES